MSNLASLQAQLAELQGLTNKSANVVPFQSPVNQNMVSEILAGLTTQIKETISSEVAGLRQELMSYAMPAAKDKKPVKKDLTILEAVGLALTPEEQLWMSKAETIQLLPSFLASDEGMDLVKLFVSDFKESVGEK